MELIQHYLTNNDVYVRNLGRIDERYANFQDIGPKGIMLHSVGYPQPKAIPLIESWDRPNKEKAVHAFIEPNVLYQTLPWNFRGWHAGGSANNTHVGVEMMEPSTIRYTGASTWVDLEPTVTEAFVRATYTNAVELFADLCKQFNLDPMGDAVILSHAEAHKRGIASNHGDPEHIWRIWGLSMDSFRTAVAEKLQQEEEAKNVPLFRVQAGAFRKLHYAKQLQETLKVAGFDTYLVQSDDGLYKVQAGAYRKKAYAENQLCALQKAGFDAYITSKSGKAVRNN